MIKRIFFLTCLLLPLFTVQAQKDTFSEEFAVQTNFAKGIVLEILEEGTEDLFGTEQLFQRTNVQIISGDEQGKIVEIEPGSMSIASEKQLLKKNQSVVLSKIENMGHANYLVIDKYRLPAILLVFAFFLGVTMIFGKRKGTFAIIGLAFSILIIAQFIIPQILLGKDPLIICFLGSVLIAVISLYLSHGFEKRTTVALWSTLITLCIAFGLSTLFVKWTHLFGLGTEESFYLQINKFHSLDMQGLLLGGIVIGTIGILDDVTTTQAATIDELLKANKNLSLSELYKRGMSVGREHIASLINTLALAYTGAALPMFLLFQTNDIRPLWVIINSEFIAEEIIRTLTGSLALVLAVPISTYLAARILKRNILKSS